ncbi:hypothetical protein [Umezakia ovalisporum]|jgi:hypothetical protein|uniref:hypothetical protein n=1 Tax=Umezakia ovalisporum TaxID=75695 RepID=UPI0026A994FB
MKGKYLILIGTALTLALSANIAIAESGTSSREIKLSPEGLKLLCEQFPLNSRCQNGIPTTPTQDSNNPTDPEIGIPENPTDPEIGIPENPTDPETLTTPESNMPN